MFLNGIDFPNQIIDAIKDNEFVVFAGAGTSVDKPTSLPDFKKLTQEIAEGTGKVLKKQESCEVFLGNLKANGIDVNQLAASILSGTCLKHNKLHEAIIDLFESYEDIRVVTTNYDQMFEQVVEERGQKVSVYSVPALPLGNDIDGIIHIHGNVCNPKYMVVTDEDFGRAYLTEGYASRFLVQLFSSYTVLFIGYSYNDTILRYLTRAISRNENNKLYILTDDQKASWSALGIKPIYFHKRSFAVMREGLIKLGLTSKKGLLELKTEFDSICDAPPKDLTVETEIDYCLESDERSLVLAHSVNGEEWLDFLDNKNVFKDCFSYEVNSDKKRDLWTSWLCDNFVGKDDERLLFLIYKYKNVLNKSFADYLARKLITQENVSAECIKGYILVLDSYLDNCWVITRLIEILVDLEEYHSAFILLKKLYQINMVLDKKIWMMQDSLEYKHLFVGNHFNINRAWELIKHKAIVGFPEEVILFAVDKITELHNKYVMSGQTSKNNDLWALSMLVIEDREKESREDPIEILSRMIVDVSISAQKANSEFFRTILAYGVNSESILLKRICLKAIREADIFTASEQMNILLENNLISSASCREQVFLMASVFFVKLALKEKNVFIDAIEQIEKSDDESSVYEVYNWLVWLQRYSPKNGRIKKTLQDILAENSFQPREHPELLTWSSPARWVHDKSPFTIEEFWGLPITKAVDELKNFSENRFEGPNRYGLLSVFSSCISKDMDWSQRIIEALIQENVTKQDVWQNVFYGLSNVDNNLDKVLNILTVASDNISIVGDTNIISDCLLKTLKRSDIKDFFLSHEEEIFTIAEALWNNRTDTQFGFSRAIDATLNTTVGRVLFSWIYMVSFKDTKSIPEKYLNHFNEALSLKTREKNVSVCVLVGNLNFFCYRDIKWSTTKLIPFLTGNAKALYTNAWEGMVYFSGGIIRDTADIVSPIYLKALNHVKWLEGEAKKGFIELFLTLLLYVIDKPTQKYIPDFYRKASVTDHRLFIETIGHRLMNMDSSQKVEWWNSWLKHFLENRKYNKPLPLEDDENQAIMNLIPLLSELFEEVVEVVCKGKVPDYFDVAFWYNLEDMHVSTKYSHSMAKLLIKVLSNINDMSYGKEYIKVIVNDLDGLDSKEEKNLQEVLLKNNIESKFS